MNLDMKYLSPVTSIFSAILLSTLIASCGKQAKMERCKFVEIEPPEFEVEIGDVDIEGGEVEMVCGDKIVDVAWNDFKRKLRIDPKNYINNLAGFKQEVSCLIDERSKKKEILCSRPSRNDEFVTIKYTLDD